VSRSALHHAIRAKEADRALEVAGAMRRVPLRYAARLTVLLADLRHPRYEAAARRFIVAFTEELEPPTMQIKKVSDALAHVHHHYYGHFARLALQNLIGQLHERGRSVDLDFERAGQPQPQAEASLAVQPLMGNLIDRASLRSARVMADTEGEVAQPPATIDDF
jgi:hypothetical protein